MSGPVIYVVRSWPRLSQTFVLNEVAALEARGLEIALFSLVRSDDGLVQPQVRTLRTQVSYLDDGRRQPLRRRVRLHASVLAGTPGRYLAVLWYALRRPRLAAGYGQCSTLRGFGHAVRIAAAVREMRLAGRGPVRVHAHFAHDPALVGMLAARLSGLPFSFTGHARDLVQIPAASLAARAEAATVVVTCCDVNARYIRTAVPDSRRPPVVVVHHGVDLGGFRPSRRRLDGRVPVLVSVGRLVEKKGYVDLLHALAAVRDDGADFRCEIYGDGPMRDELCRLRDRLELAGHVLLLGACGQDRIRQALGGADGFVLTPRPTADGDREGIPNVLVEAMACALPVVTTAVGGIGELVTHGHNGLLCPPGDVPGIADALIELLRDPWLRAVLGDNGRRTVAADYDVHTAARTLEHLLLAHEPRQLEVSR